VRRRSGGYGVSGSSFAQAGRRGCIYTLLT
jgi:hypothetical protein